jgi:hypothetical protein
MCGRAIMAIVRRVLIATGVTAALLVGGGATSVAHAATQTQRVSITSHMDFNFPDPNTGDFTTSGAATESGLICSSGTVLDVGLVFSGFESKTGQIQILVRKLFTCDDGSGNIFVKIQVHANPDGTETFTWVVLGGTGAYQNLHGSGQGTTVPNADPSTGNTNFYEGFLVG